MPTITPDALLHLASSIEGERLTTTARRAGFSVAVLPSGLEITPESSRKPRLVPHERISAVLNEFDRTRSLRPGSYHHITFDSSYLLALIERYLRGRDPA